MQKIFTLVLTLWLGIGQLTSQVNIGIGQWQSHLPYQYGRYVTQSESTVYFATDWSVLTIEKSDRSIGFLSSVNGLSNTGIGVIKYNSPGNVLVVTYTNSVIDLVKEDEVLTLADIRNFSNQIINKSINDIYVASATATYIAGGYGISQLNTEKGLFSFTTFTGLPVNSILIFQDTLLAATDEGVYATPVENPFVQDFATWEYWGPERGFPGDYRSEVMAVHNDILYLDVNDSLYRYDRGSAAYFYHADNLSSQFLTAEGKHLLYGMRCHPDCQGKVVRFGPDPSGLSTAGGVCVDRPLHAIEDQFGTVWFGDGFRGVRVSENFTNQCSSTIFNSPFSHFSSEMAVFDSKLYVASGGLRDNGSNQFRTDGFFTLIDGDWKVINARNTPLLKDKQADNDFYRIAVHPGSGKVYFGTFYGGIVTYDGENIEVLNETNSALQGAIGDPARERIGGLAFDREENLWISNHSAPKPLVVMTAEGEWLSYTVPTDRKLDQLLVDQNGYKWIIAGTGVLVFDDAGTLKDISDDRFRFFTESNSTLPSTIVNCLEADLDGKVWIGTSNGVVVFECDPFNEECVGSLIIVEENDIDEEDEYLLKGEDVRSIAVDGANRKWFGTTNGIFVQSPNAKDQVHVFNTSNSPLFDNLITDIAIDHASGLVYIGTSKGIISYRGEATAGGRVNNINAYAFPNPVRPGYEGPIAIKGLAEDANIKITDITGQLIYETTALGGQAIWDGRDYNGRRASSGVYLVFATRIDLNNPDTLVTKILIIN